MAVLPEQELVALELLSLGYTTSQIAGEMHVSHRTVQRWLENVYTRLGAVNGCSAVRIAMELGIFSGWQSEE